MTTVRDFTSPELESTLQPPHPPQTSTSGSGLSFANPISPMAPISPISTIDINDSGRRPSRASTCSAKTASGGVRRRRNRTNTLQSYHEPDSSNWQPGAEPGIDTNAEDDRLPAHLSTLKADCDINIIDFSTNTEPRIMQATNETLADRLLEPRPEGISCRWISVNGLSWDVIKCLGNKYNLHRLAIEDMIHTHTRTKVDWYADHAFVVLTLQKLVKLHQHRGHESECGCEASLDDKDAFDEKMEEAQQAERRRSNFGRRRSTQKDILPRYLDRDHDGKIDEFVLAHSGISESDPIKPIRTLHRYESAQIPEHTAFMERHSALAADDLAVSVEQVSLFLLSDNTVISFFEHSAEDVETPIMARLKSPETMLRISCDASLMLQAIIDAIVDLAVRVKDAYNKSRKELQVDAMTNPDIKTSRALHIFGEEIDMLQNLFKPIVHLVNALRDHNIDPTLSTMHSFTVPAPAYSHLPLPEQSVPEIDIQGPMPNVKVENQTKRDRDGAPPFLRSISGAVRRAPFKRTETTASVIISPLAHTYFGDVLDHCITIIQSFEQMDASATNISTLIFNTVGAKTNNFMMILAVVTVFFAPLTFISGYFGMNFAEGSGLKHPFGFFWIVAIPALTCFMLLVFATMLWENVEDFLAKRGIRAHRRRRQGKV
ncbi:cobalt/magnesium transport protein cora [Acrodontium crateriforme]|uniref:Cobalt/magnesium transport protein cora n=1 Tax=Acrodontium crateriforme TaxID=150365 RepID=A0AAQ3M1C6_9PEZI|nr:cobalt/magnesium transport protein cora [Acrodontium crateriforme]